MNLPAPRPTGPRPHGPWQIVCSEERYRDPWVTLYRDEVIRPDGRPGTHVLVELKPGVCVIALGEDQTVYLTEEFHYAVGRVTWEAASGGIEPGENALETAQRELLEELGISAGQWIDLGVCDPFTASILSPTRLYLARDLCFGESRPEGTELIHCRAIPFAQAVQLVMDSVITHAPTCVAILKAARLLDSEART